MKKAGACDAPAELAMVELGLPGISALEVAHRLKERWPVTRVALMTGYGNRMNPDDAESRGVDLVLAKPFSLDHLRSGSITPWRMLRPDTSGGDRLAAPSTRSVTSPVRTEPPPRPHDPAANIGPVVLPCAQSCRGDVIKEDRSATKRVVARKAAAHRLRQLLVQQAQVWLQDVVHGAREVIPELSMKSQQPRIFELDEQGLEQRIGVTGLPANELHLLRAPATVPSSASTSSSSVYTAACKVMCDSNGTALYSFASWVITEVNMR